MPKAGWRKWRPVADLPVVDEQGKTAWEHTMDEIIAELKQERDGLKVCVEQHRARILHIDGAIFHLRALLEIA